MTITIFFGNKVYDFNKNQPELSSSDVDWAEFEKDYNSHLHYESMIARLESLVIRLKNAKTLHDYIIIRRHLQSMGLLLLRRELLPRGLK